jgi:hypothetical protein
MGVKLQKRGIYLFNCTNEGDPLVGNISYASSNPNKPHYFLILSHAEYNEKSTHLSAVSMTTAPKDSRYVHQFDVDNFDSWESVPHSDRDGLLKSKLLLDKVCRVDCQNLATGQRWERPKAILNYDSYKKIIEKIKKSLL